MLKRVFYSLLVLLGLLLLTVLGLDRCSRAGRCRSAPESSTNMEPCPSK